MRDYEHTPLANVQAWSEVPGNTLFQTTVRFENQSWDSLSRMLGVLVGLSESLSFPNGTD